MKKLFYLFISLFSCSMIFAQNNLVPNTQDCSSVGAAFDFEIERRWISSTGDAILTDCTPLAGDIDGDGKTEIFAVATSKIYIFDGSDGTTIGSIDVGTTITNWAWTGTPFVIFRDKTSGKGRVFITSSSKQYYMYEISSGEGVRPITFKKLWQKTGTYSRQYVSPVISDLDGDGTPEFVVADKIVDYNGNEKATMAFSGTAINFGYVSLPLVADLDGDQIPEIVVGTNVYKYNGSTVSLWKQMPGAIAQDGTNMAADINQDGVVDLVFHTMYQAPTGFVKVWSPATGEDLGTVVTNLGNGQRSIPFVGDIDGKITNGKKYPEICINTVGTLYAYSYTGSGFTQKWSMSHSDRSGGTILTLYDFNNDGTMELIYRDETLLHIFDGSGSTPVSKYTITCGSETASELPIVVDASGDGSANIVVTGNATTGTAAYGEVMCFQGGASKWASCPNVWNQQLYSSLYVNTDLTIPERVKPVNLTFTRPDNSTVQFYNGGPMQAPYVSEETFLPVNLSPDVYVVDGSIQILSTSSVQITVTFGNQGMAVASASTPIQFYKNAIATANIIGSETLGVNLDPGQTRTITKTLNGVTGVSQFYVRIVDDGTNFPALGAFSECNLTNNTQSFGTLELKKTVTEQNACLYGTSFFIIELINNTGQLGLPQAFHDIIITDSLGAGWEYLDANTNVGTIGSYVSATRSLQWTIPVLADGDTVRMMLEAKPITSGAIRNSAWIAGHDGVEVEKDNIEAFVIVNSQAAPGAAVITPEVPHLTVEGDVVLTATASESGVTSYQWYKDGQKIDGATGQTYTATEEGEYYVTYTNGTCSSEVSEKITVLPVLANNSVFYDGNDQTSGTAPEDTVKYVADEVVTVKGNTDLTKTDATFIGWSFNTSNLVTAPAEVPGDLMQPDTTFVISSDTTLYAVWAADSNGPNNKPDSVPDYDQFNVIYHGNNHTSGTIPEDKNLYSSGYHVVTKLHGDLKREDDPTTAILFAGWAPTQISNVLTQANAVDTTSAFVREGNTFEIMGNTTMYAVWSTDENGNNIPDIFENGYKVAYNGNGHTEGTEPTDATVYLINTIAIAKSHGDLKRTGGADPILFAGWTPTPVSDVLTAANAADTTSAFVRSGNPFTITGNVTMYAVWSTDGNGNNIPDIFETEYNVTYDGNGATGTAPSDATNYLSGMTVTVLGNTGPLTKTDATFIGWSFGPSNLVTAPAEEPGDLMQPDTTFIISGNTMLYAVWAIDKNGPGGGKDSVPDYKQFTVTYHGNGHTSGSVPKDNKLYSHGVFVTTELHGNLEKSGTPKIVFAGWAPTQITHVLTSANAADTTSAFVREGNTFEITGNTTMYAVWSTDGNGNNIPDIFEDGYKVTYDGNSQTSGDAPEDNTEYLTGMKAVAKAKGNLAKNDAIFIGWSTENTVVEGKDLKTMQEVLDAKVIAVDSAFAVPTDMLLYAVWAADVNGPGGEGDNVPDYLQFAVIYDGNGETDGEVIDGNIYNKDMNVVLKDKGNLVKTDRVFLGWNRTQQNDLMTVGDYNDFILLGTMKKGGETFVITEKTTWYAVWAKDENGNGIPDYLEIEIIYHWGAMDGPVVRDTVESGVAFPITDMGFNDYMYGYVIIGWHEMNVPIIVSTLAMENSLNAMPQFHAVGSSLSTTKNMDLYAIWARDANNDGYPDYGGSIVRPQNGTRNQLLSGDDATGNDVITGARVWAHGSTMYINTDKAVRASIYTIGGTLYKQMDIPEGLTSESLKAGIYIVEMEGVRYKVVVK